MTVPLAYPAPWQENWVDISGPDSEIIVVLIHGTLDRSAGMARLSRLTSRTHRTLRFDRRGYGRHSDHPGPFTVAGNAHDVVRLIGDHAAVLVGHSYGGNVALATAEMLPQQVLGVSTYETPLSWCEWWPSDSAGGAALSVEPEDAAETFMIRMIGEKRWNELPDSTKRQRRKEGKALTAELSHLRHGQPWDALNIKCPVLCGRGTHAQPHHQTAAKTLAGMFQDGHEVIIEGAGHGAPISHPQEFFDLLVSPHLDGRGTLTVMS